MPRKKTQSAFVDAVRESLRQVIGTYGIAVIHADVSGVLIGARRGSPLVLGVGKGEHFSPVMSPRSSRIHARRSI